MRVWLTAAALVLGGAQSAEAAQRLLVAPGNPGGDCLTTRCSLADANLASQDGDTIELGPGDYAGLGDRTIDHDVSIVGGLGTDRPVLHVRSLSLRAPGVVLEDVKVLGTTTDAVLDASDATLKRVDVGDEPGASPRAICSFSGTTSVRDSRCLALHSGGQAVDVTGGNADLRNVTAAAVAGAGIAVTTGGVATHAIVHNTIAVGGNHDQQTNDLQVFGENADVRVDHSRYASWGAANAANTLNGGFDLRDGNTGATVDSMFADLGGEERPGSPTIDAGATDVATGELDLLGRPRAQGGAPDIGALEFVPGAPLATTGDATSVGTNSVVIPGSIDPHGQATSFRVEWGTTTAYGAATEDTGGIAGTLPVPVTASLSGLAEDTTYHYRVVATNASGTSYGADKTFTTFIHPASPPPPVVKPKPKVTIGLPSNQRCRATRTLSLKPRIAKGGTITAVSVYVKGKRVKRVTGTKARRTIKLTKLPRGSYTLEVRVTTKDGRTVKIRKRYRTCARAG